MVPRAWVRLAAPILLCGVLLRGQSACAERPPSHLLLPKETVAFLRIASAPKLAEAWRTSSAGRLASDPQLKPLVEQLYGSAVEAAADIEEKLGVRLDELLASFAGEISIGLVVPPEDPWGVVALIDVGDHTGTASVLIDNIGRLLVESGATRTEETVGETRFAVFELPEQRGVVIQFEREGTVVFSNSLAVVRHVLLAWNGRAPGENLSQNENYLLVVNQSRGPAGEEPHVLVFGDPIGIASGVFRHNPAAQAALLFLPYLGLDGLKSAGLGVTLSTAEFDSYQRTHVFMDSSRDGILAAAAFKTGDLTPERWVPKEANAYVSLHWDARRTYEEVTKMMDGLPGREKGAAASRVREAFQRFDVDFEKDLLGQIDGRVTLFTWFENAVSIASNRSAVGIRLRDPRRFQATFEKLIAAAGSRLKKRSFGGVDYYTLEVPGPRPEPFPGARPEPSFVLLDDYVLYGDKPPILERAILTHGGAVESLAGSLEFKVVQAKIDRLTGGDGISMISWSSPESALRFWYDMASGSRAGLREGVFAERMPFLREVDRALEKNPLPPFSVIQQYVAPTGGFMISDETGWHWVEFALRLPE